MLLPKTSHTRQGFLPKGNIVTESDGVMLVMIVMEMMVLMMMLIFQKDSPTKGLPKKTSKCIVIFSYIQTLLEKKHVYESTQRFLHTHVCTKCFDTPIFLHRDAFTRRKHMRTLNTEKHRSTQMRLHTGIKPWHTGNQEKNMMIIIVIIVTIEYKWI